MLIAALLIASGAWADAGWTDRARVAELQATIHGRFLLRLEGPDNPSGCRRGEWFYRDQRGPGSQQMFRLLLSAAERRSQVRVYVTGVCDLDGFSEISRVTLLP